MNGGHPAVEAEDNTEMESDLKTSSKKVLSHSSLLFTNVLSSLTGHDSG